MTTLLTHLLLQLNDVIKVAVVHVCIYSEQALEDGLGNCDEVARKGGTCMVKCDVCIVCVGGDI